MLLLLLACPKAPTPPPVVDGLPLLPAPDAPIYSAAPGAPKDPLVAWAVPKGALYDDALAGAAAGLAQVISDHKGYDEAALRWACLRAGWPYGTEKVWWVRTAEDQAPPNIQSLLEKEKAPLGLARFRDRQGDVWVLITGSITVMLPPIDREPDIGDRVSVQPKASGWSEWSQRVLPPNGAPHTGPAVYGEPGEWLLELSAVPEGGSRRVVAQLPIYVGEETPSDGPFLQVDLEKPAASTAPGLALTRLNVLRDVLGVGDLEADALLDSAARTGLTTASTDPWTKAGYREGVQLECIGDTVRGCLDDLFWDIDSRAGLREEDLKAVGVGADWTEQGLHMVLILGG